MISRRSLLRTGFHAGVVSLTAPYWMSSRRVFGANETLNVAGIGVGGQGASDLAQVAGAANVRIVGLCDVDARHLAAAETRYPDAASFSDYRVMFDTMAAGIDAVVISTPDHMHGPIALAAMALGKHVYVQKPLAHNIRELRAMQVGAERSGVVTQMGTQIHSHSAYLTAVALVKRGVIGTVSEAHLWVSKSWAGPPEGRPRFQDDIPAHLDWDQWLGVAPERPFVNGIYHPGNWRGWQDFGSGTLGDMGCHIFDPVFGALGIKEITSVVSHGPKHYGETFGPNSDVRYTFKGTDRTTESLKFRWTDGNTVSRPDASKAQLPEGVNLPGAGSFLVGENGVMVIPHWSDPQIYTDGQRVDIPYERIASRNHYHEWADACRGEGATSTPFTYSGPVTEAVLVGTIAGHHPQKTLAWNSSAMTFDDAAATARVSRTYRDGRVPALG